MRREGTGGRGGRRGRREGELAAKARGRQRQKLPGAQGVLLFQGYPPWPLHFRPEPGRLRKMLKRRAHDGKLMQLPVQTPSLGEPADALGLI